MSDYLKELVEEKNYLKLSVLDSNSEIIETIETLKDMYLETKTKIRFGVDSETADFLNHSEQSEILGKILMLCHECGGYKMVVETVMELHFKIDEMMIEAMEKMEKEIGEKTCS